jgi:thiol-disulfide isomerase/thioredoxin
MAMAAMTTMKELLPDLAVTTLVPEGDEPEMSSLCRLRDGKAMVIDFWTTKCTRCPAALEKLNNEAGLAENDDIVFVSCALSQGEGNYAVAADLVCDGSFDDMTHCFMEMDVKETAKTSFGFTSVPFYVVTDKVLQSDFIVDCPVY